SYDRLLLFRTSDEDVAAVVEFVVYDGNRTREELVRDGMGDDEPMNMLVVEMAMTPAAKELVAKISEHHDTQGGNAVGARLGVELPRR
ncbi:MAG: hypothetical protein LC792_26305, partial [Actinobacteria bacterium]|nr:hypothetical protein [Actinomycetota bacterium]